MNNEICVKIKNCEKHILMQPGFYDLLRNTHFSHTHNYTEIHIIFQGNVWLHIDKSSTSFNEGDVVVIPPQTHHHCIETSEGAKSLAFLIQDTLPYSHYTIPLGIANAFMNLIENLDFSDDHGKVAAYISLVCNDLYPDDKFYVHNVVSRSFLMSDFFSNFYATDSTIDDLAKILNLSTKQTERLVKQYTGRTFKQEIVNRKMAAAKHLMDTTDMTLTEIAEHIGYQSYSGFWKAYTNYLQDLAK